MSEFYGGIDVGYYGDEQAATFRDKETLKFLLDSGIAQAYQVHLERKANEQLSEDDYIDALEMATIPGLTDAEITKQAARIALNKQLSKKEAAIGDLKIELSKHIWRDEGSIHYFICKTEPEDDSAIITESMKYIRTVNISDEGVVNIDDENGIGLSQEQVEAAVDYIEARIANNGAPLGEHP